MKAEKENIDALIITYLTDGLDKNALDELKEWIAASVENERYFMRLQDIWFSAIKEEDNISYNKDMAFERFKTRVANQKREGDTSRKQLRLPLFWRYAVAVVLLGVISYSSYWGGRTSIKDEFSDIVVEAPLGSRTKLGLPDGTQVWLNAGSRMIYSQGFGVDNREIGLSGEGYFEVTRHDKIPFLVKTDNLEVTVVGTKFNFRDYPDDTEAIVSLTEGKVGLTNLLKQQNEALLLPNERVVLNKKNGEMIVESTMASNALQWTRGFLFFDEELLPDIAKELERNYNVEIAIENDSLNSFRFYGNFIYREQSIEEVLEALSTTQKINYTLKGRHITLY